MANTREIIGDQETVDGLVSNTLTSLEEDGITVLSDYALYSKTALTSINFPNLTDTGEYAFHSCSGLTDVSLPNVTSVGAYAFYGCSALPSINLPKVTSIGNYAFSGCTALASVTLPKAVLFGPYAFSGCSALTILDLPDTVSSILANHFSGSGLTHLILRKSDGIVTLSNVNAFSGTPIAQANGAIYVPAALIDTYRTDTNWSNYFICDIADYPVDVNTLKPQSWAEVNEASENGTYTKYALGITLPITSGSYTFDMELIAKDTDDLADGSGKAHMTWLAKGIVLTAAMNSEFVDYTDSSLYTTILPDLKSGIDSTIQGYMKPVTKTRRDNSGTTQSSNETFWIPSYRETFGSTSKESSGCIYNFRFPSNAARMKSSSWWLRTYNSDTTYGVVRYDGAHIGYVVTSARGVVPGFCI